MRAGVAPGVSSRHEPAKEPVRLLAPRDAGKTAGTCRATQTPPCSRTVTRKAAWRSVNPRLATASTHSADVISCMVMFSLRRHTESGEPMNVDLTADQRAFVQRAIDSGRLQREEDAIREALALWEERERRRLELLAMLDEADASLARGEGREITEESMKALAEDIKRRGRLRIAAEGADRR